MGGCCCCASKGVQLNRSPPFYHYPRVSEEREPLSPYNGTASALVDTNLDTSIPDTYRAPPTPLPYDANLVRPRTPPGNREYCVNKSEIAVQTTNDGPVEESNTGNTDETTVKDEKESDCKVKTDIELAESKELEDEKPDELKKSTEPIVSALEEEEVCPTCFEEYDKENPKIITKCEHHFHLGCILEWMERSDTCPICDQEMVFNAKFDG